LIDPSRPLPRVVSEDVELSDQPARATRAQAACNVEVCRRFYRSFDPSDCTYRPRGGGPRRICAR
jgi:hypothetical protein